MKIHIEKTKTKNSYRRKKVICVYLNANTHTLNAWPVLVEIRTGKSGTVPFGDQKRLLLSGAVAIAVNIAPSSVGFLVTDLCVRCPPLRSRNLLLFPYIISYFFYYLFTLVSQIEFICTIFRFDDSNFSA